MTEDQLHTKVQSVALECGVHWRDASLLADRFVRVVQNDRGVDLPRLTWANIPRHPLHALVDDIARSRCGR